MQADVPCSKARFCMVLSGQRGTRAARAELSIMDGFARREKLASRSSLEAAVGREDRSGREQLQQLHSARPTQQYDGMGGDATASVAGRPLALVCRSI